MSKHTMSRDIAAVQRAALAARRAGRLGAIGFAATLATLASGIGVGRAAAASGVAWSVQVTAQPSNFQPSDGNDQYSLLLTNVGNAASSGPVTVTDTLPAGLTTSQTPYGEEILFAEGGEWECSPGAGQSVVACTLQGPVAALGQPTAIHVPVSVASGGPQSVVNDVQVAGGGAAECGGSGQPICASGSVSIPVGPQAVPFGVQDLRASTWDGSGGLDTQAGSHPWGLTTDFGLPTVNVELAGGGVQALSVEGLKQVVVDLPAGLVGNPLAAPTCRLSDATNIDSLCAPATRLGTIALLTRSGGSVANLPIYNMVPEQGHPAEFSLFESNLRRPSFLFGGVRPGDYGVRVVSAPAPRAVPVDGISTTFYGDPAVRDQSGNTPLAFLTNPANCSGRALTETVHVDSWQHPGRFNADGSPDFSDPNWKGATATLPPVGNCEALHFSPSIDMHPETTQASSPSGYTFDLSVPQDNQPNGLATPPLKRATVTLPEGVAVSPSTADGLQACRDAQLDVGSTEPASCPLASQVATVTARTPVLSETVTGQVFVGSPDCGPCSAADAQAGRMLRLFLQVQIPGASLKFPGTVSVDPATGRLTATFAGLIQQPVSDIQLQFKGGPRAPLANPRTCGVSTTTSDLEPWSAPATADGTPSASFETTGCGDPGQFAPSFLAGTLSNQAGGFSPFNVSLSRTDQDQELGGVTVKTPPGLLGILDGVERCPEPQAAQGACGVGSVIGHATAAAGPGSHPYSVQGGQVFLTGPYKGAPFGLSIVVPAVAGPFNLGNVVVRAAVSVDPHTAQITVASDPLPTILDGVPLQLKTVNVSIDRQGFMFNPTNCDPLAVNGTLTSTQGAAVPVSSRFQAANCAALAFKPSFTVSTQARTSKKNGASLDVKLAYPQGSQANIRSVAVTLPKQLPSRLTTIQQACPEATFAANPASCPAGSNIGIATAHTPVLASALTGPAYLVSHGGAAFPDLVLILQGEGVTLDLVGSIDIKKGVTSSTFASVPDAPISSFELSLPEGPHSGLAAVVPAKAKGNLCGQSLTMPTTMTGQNGAQIKQSTKIKVTGCPKVKKKAKHTRRTHGKKSKHAKKRR